MQAWAPAQEDPEVWHQRLHGSYALLAFTPEQNLLGFGNVVCPAPVSDQELFNSLKVNLCSANPANHTATTSPIAAGAQSAPASVTTGDAASVSAAHAALAVSTTAASASTATAAPSFAVSTADTNIALLDYLYVNAANQGQHVGTQLCVALEHYLLQHHCSFVLTHASLTAQGFFAQRGYTILKKQQVERSEQLLENALMGKRLTASLDAVD